MNKTNGIGWKLLLLGLVTSVVLYTFASWIHLSVVSRQMIFVFTLFIPMTVGAMTLYRRRSLRRPEESAWNNDENFRRY